MYDKQHQRDHSFSANDFKKEWIANGFKPETITFAEDFGKALAIGRLTTSQIRNIYGEVIRIAAKIESEAKQKGSFSLEHSESFKEFLLLKPKLAYAAARAGSRGIKVFQVVMNKAYDAVLSAENKIGAFENFVDFFEATLAYHKVSGGRD